MLKEKVSKEEVNVQVVINFTLEYLTHILKGCLPPAPTHNMVFFIVAKILSGENCPLGGGGTQEFSKFPPSHTMYEALHASM